MYWRENKTIEVSFNKWIPMIAPSHPTPGFLYFFALMSSKLCTHLQLKNFWAPIKKGFHFPGKQICNTEEVFSIFIHKIPSRWFVVHFTNLSV